MIGYLRRQLNGEVIDFVELDMPTHTLDTVAVMCTITPEALQDNGIEAIAHSRARCMPPSTPRSDCCRWSPAATAATSAGCPLAVGPETGLPTIFVYDGYPGRCGVRRSRLPADRRRGGVPPPRRSRRANAHSAARRACSRRSAETATTRSTRRARFACYVWCSANWCATRRENRRDDRPLDGRLHGSAIDGAGSGTPNTKQVATNGRTTRSVLESRKPGADAKYLVAGLQATWSIDFRGRQIAWLYTQD